MTPVRPEPNVSFSTSRRTQLLDFIFQHCNEVIYYHTAIPAAGSLVRRMAQIQATSSVKDHNVATEAQNLSRRGRGRVRSMVETLNQYPGVPDIVSQWASGVFRSGLGYLEMAISDRDEPHQPDVAHYSYVGGKRR
jgi:hypothetical protein